MKYRIIKMAIFIFLIVFVATSAIALDRGHVYINGKVDKVSNNAITISGVDYDIAPECKVDIQFKKERSYYEKEGKLSDIRTGDSVYAKKIGQTLYEIKIEEWR